MTAYLHLFSTANALVAWTVLYLIFLRPAFAAALSRAAGAEDFWLIFTPSTVTMSQKSSDPQLPRSVSKAPTPDSPCACRCGPRRSRTNSR